MLQQDGRAWRNLMAPLAKNWPAFAKDVLQPLLRFPSHPFLLANFAQDALAPATFVARRRFRNERTRALFAGLAAHSFLSLNEPLSASFGMVLGAAAHAVGWPIPRGGAQAITNALSAHLVRLGGKIIPSSRVDRPRPGSQIRCRALRHHAAATVTSVTRKAVAGISQAHGGIPLRTGNFQSGLRSFIADSVEVGGLSPRRNRASGRNHGGNCRVRSRNGKRRDCRAAVRVAGAADVIRSLTRTCWEAHCMGLLSRSQQFLVQYAAANRSADRALRSRISRLRPGAARFVSGRSAIHGCQPGRWRYQRRRVRFSTISLSPNVAAICNLRRANLPLLIFYAAGRRCAWHVWLQRRKARASSSAQKLREAIDVQHDRCRSTR